MRPSNKFFRVLQGLFAIAILVFWIRALASHWDELAAYPWHVSWGWLLASQLLLFVQSLLLATIWWWAVRLMGEPVSWWRGSAIWLTTQIARYLPGGVWDIAGRLAIGYKEGMGVRAMSASIVLEMALQILSASLFLLLIPLLRGGEAAVSYLPVAAALAVGSLIVLMPPVFGRLINFGLRVLRRPPLAIRMTYRDTLGLFGARLVAHLLLAVGFVLFARGVIDITWQQVPIMMAAYVGAWLVGYVMIFVPMGIGVREGVLVLLLQGVFPFGVLGGVALGYRVWLLLRDLIAALVGLWMTRRDRTRTSSPAPSALGPGSADT